MTSVDHSPPFDEAMEVTVAEGAVVILGPDAIAVSLTPDAAERSASRLVKAAQTARETGGAPPQPIDPS